MNPDVWDAASVAAKAVLYAATLSAAGGAAFAVQHDSAMGAALRGRIRRWLAGCLGVALLLTAVRIGILAAAMGDAVDAAFDGTMVRMVLEAGEGRAMAVRVLGLLAIGLSLARPRRSVALALGGALLSATSFAWVGHAWAASRGYELVALQSVHLGGVAFWIGALVPLWMATRHDTPAALAVLVRSFGRAAQFVVAGLIAVGVLLLVVLLRSPSELWSTEYGRLVLLKLGGVGALLGVAEFNKLRLTPRLLASDSMAVTALRRSIGLEVALAVTILLVTAAFTTLVGPASLE